MVAAVVHAELLVITITPHSSVPTFVLVVEESTRVAALGRVRVTLPESEELLQVLFLNATVVLVTPTPALVRHTKFL